MNNRIEILDHTADIGIRVQADTLEELLILAGETMMQIIVNETPQDCGVFYDLEITGDDHEQLLVNWLSELNFLLQTQSFVFAGCSHAVLKDHSFKCCAVGETAGARSLTIHTEVKAVTYHKIYVRRSERGVWEAQVYLDL